MFEKKLVDNITCYLTKQGITAPIHRPRGRIIVEHSQDVNLRCVFGLSSYSLAVVTDATIDAILQRLPYEHITKDSTFAIHCQRLDKTLPFTSHDVAVAAGKYIQDKTQAKVHLDNPDHKILIELMHGKAYIATKKVRCFGGLPVGVEGTVVALVNSDQDVLAALLVMRRGCAVVPVTEKSYNNPLLKSYSCKEIAPQHINRNEIDTVINTTKALALVVGDTVDALQSYETSYVVLRPLVGFTKKQIKEQLHEFNVCQ